MCVQPNALLGARSNVVRTTQRGPRMLLGTDGLRSARAMPLLQQAVDPNLRPTHTVVKMADAAVAGGKKGFTLDVQLIAYFALWYLGNYYCKPLPLQSNEKEIGPLFLHVFTFFRMQKD
jgi:hypothetical protein